MTFTRARALLSAGKCRAIKRAHWKLALTPGTYSTLNLMFARRGEWWLLRWWPVKAHTSKKDWVVLR